MPSRKPPARGDALARYRDKRRAGATPEPFGRAAPAPAAAGNERLFVVQCHAARAAHFDFRLEVDGVLRSWAVPKGPSANPADKRFAALVEDHPLDYADFEGRIPEGNYGAGEVIVWDRGTWDALNDVDEGFRKGKLLFELHGYKLHGRWTLVRMKKAGKDTTKDWLMIKERDAHAVTENTFPADSVLSGLTVEELRDPAASERALLKDVKKHRAVRRNAEAVDPQRFVPAPMLATSDSPFDREGWLFEIKYDGYRMFAVKHDDRVELVSRNGHRLTERFPEIVHTVLHLPVQELVIDGEIVVHDADGRPSFGRLQERLALAGEWDVARAARYRPATYYAFDLTSLGGFDLTAAPLSSRKAWLERLLPTVGAIRYSSHVADRGRATFEAAHSLGLEGVVGKRGDSRYVPGRSNDWVKVRARKTGDFVVAGWVPSKSNRNDIGALALAEYRNGTLTAVGRVGSGLGSAVRRELGEVLHALAPGAPLNDDKDHRWVEPTLVCEVEFREYTRDGHLRQPVFVRMRPDKSTAECVGRFDDPDPAILAPAVHEVIVTHREKVFFPALSPGKGLTKGDLVDYYQAISKWMLPYLEDRPLVLTRFPDGIDGKSFYQRDAPAFVPDWVQREVLWSESAEREVHYFIAQDEASLVYLANMGTIPIHSWHSRITDLEHPDWCVLDLDPKEAPFESVVAAARAAKALADELEFPAFLKTSGASGLHVLLPLANQLTHDQSRTLGELMARVLVNRHRDLVTITRSLRRRDGRVYIDYLQNGHGRLLVAPFSVRAEPAASVSMPLEWTELGRRLSNAQHHIGNAVRRMQKLGHDPLAGLLTTRPDLPRVLERLAALLR